MPVLWQQVYDSHGSMAKLGFLRGWMHEFAVFKRVWQFSESGDSPKWMVSQDACEVLYTHNCMNQYACMWLYVYIYIYQNMHTLHEVTQQSVYAHFDSTISDDLGVA